MHFLVACKGVTFSMVLRDLTSTNVQRGRNGQADGNAQAAAKGYSCSKDYDIPVQNFMHDTTDEEACTGAQPPPQHAARSPLAVITLQKTACMVSIVLCLAARRNVFF